MKTWDELSIKDKNDIIRVAVQNGITTLPEIRERYNEFAEGGPTISDEEYQGRMRQVAQENWRNWGYRNEEEAYQDQINNPTYDYRSFYANNPGAVNNTETHWPDTYKGALHHTFSDESVYNGNINPIYNPSGIKGGRWTEKGFVPHGEQFAIPFNMLGDGGKIHIKPSHRGKFTALKKRTGHSASWFKAHGTPAQRKMATFELNARKWKHGDGGNLFDEGGDTDRRSTVELALDLAERFLARKRGVQPDREYTWEEMKQGLQDLAPDDNTYNKGWLDGITVTNEGTRDTNRDDWEWAENMQAMQDEAESVRRGIDRNGTPIAAGIYALAAAPFAIEGLGSSAIANGVRTGLQAMNTAFTPSTWLNPVTGAKLLSPTVGTIADAGIQGAFAYEGLNGLWNQGKQGTLLSDPASTFMHGLSVLPLASPAAKVANEAVEFVKSPGRYVFNHMPYKTLDKLMKLANKDVFYSKRTLAGNRPLNVNSEQTYKTYTGNDLETFNRRMKTVHPELVGSVGDIPVVDYLPLKDIYDYNKSFYKGKPFSLLKSTFSDYLRSNLFDVVFANPGMGIVKVNIPHMKANGVTLDAIIPHEFAHIYRDKDKVWGINSLPNGIDNGFVSSIFPEQLAKYLTGDELLTRGTQLKNYFGIVDDSPITADMLKYAAKNYVKDTGIDNNMNHFFHTINASTSKMTDSMKAKYKDGWGLAANYLSNLSYANGGPLVGMAMGGRFRR